MTPRTAGIVALAAGIAAVIVASLVGSGDGSGLAALAQPPDVIRAVLVGGSVAVGLALLTRSVARLADAGADDVPGLIRAVRLAFLAVAAFAAGAGWALGHPLPIVVAAVIAGIDVIETSILLIVVAGRR
ncbi:MAG TPA: hypothetical protein VIH00_02035 [Candidatus Limnocylindrales bacterium]